MTRAATPKDCKGRALAIGHRVRVKQADDPNGWLIVGAKRDGRLVLNKRMGRRLVQAIWSPGLVERIARTPA